MTPDSLPPGPEQLSEKSSNIHPQKSNLLRDRAGRSIKNIPRAMRNLPQSAKKVTKDVIDSTREIYTDTKTLPTTHRYIIYVGGTVLMILGMGVSIPLTLILVPKYLQKYICFVRRRVDGILENRISENDILESNTGATLENDEIIIVYDMPGEEVGEK